MRIVCLIALCWLSPVRAAPAQILERFQFEHAAMGTVVALTFYASDSSVARAAASAVFARIDSLERHLSDYDPESEISLLSNMAGTGAWVPVSAELWAVLTRAEFWAERSHGAFDITVGPLTRLWRWSHRRNMPVDTVQSAAALTSVGFAGLRLDSTSQRAKLEWSGMRLDVGGIGKGYAADEALRVLRAHGMTRALVDAGGDLAIGEAPPGAWGWRVAIPASDQSGQPTRDVRVMANTAVATSGDEYQFIETDGQRASHLIDPRTGKSISEQRIVTVVAPTGIDADALASSVSILGAQVGLDLVGSTNNTCVRVLERRKSEPPSWQFFDGCRDAANSTMRVPQ